jgi:diguanylate cyclase (GGDEF)-like protein/PAS domain S-box-containing protein
MADEQAEARAVPGLLGLSDSRETGNLLRVLTSHTPVGVFLADANGACEFVNQRWCELSGLSFEQALGGGWRTALHPDDIERVTSEWKAAEAQQRDSIIPYRFLRPDGSVTWIEGYASAFRGEGGVLVGWIGACLDVTAYRLTEHELVRERELFRVAFDAAPIGVALVDLDGRWLSANKALCRFLGYSHEELRGLDIHRVTHPADRDAQLALAARLLAGELDSYQLESRYLPKHGPAVWGLLSVALVRDELGQPVHFIAHVEDIADRKRAEQELRDLAERDALTGLLNRRSFDREFELRLSLASGAAPLSLLLVDIDHFKRVNDTLGHEAGDRALVAVAGALRARARATDLVARLGGDEFALVVCTDDPERLAGDLLEAIRACSATCDGADRGLSVSIGIAQSSAAVESAVLLAAADAALYRAKSAGRDRAAYAGERELAATA